MVNQKLVKYFEVYTAKGYKHPHLKNHLVTVGFHPQEIDEAIKFLQERKNTEKGQNEPEKARMPEPGAAKPKPIEVKILSSLYFIFAFMLFFYGLMLLVTPSALPDSEFLRGIIGEPVSFFAVFLLIVAAVSVFVGWGIWNVSPWAKTEGLVLSVLAAFTVIGILITFMTIYFFSRKDIRELFAAKGKTQSVSTSDSSKIS